MQTTILSHSLANRSLCVGLLAGSAPQAHG